VTIDGFFRAYLWTGRFISRRDGSWRCYIVLFGVYLWAYGPKFDRPGDALRHVKGDPQ
jgi:hypothetical protein